MCLQQKGGEEIARDFYSWLARENLLTFRARALDVYVMLIPNICGKLLLACMKNYSNERKNDLGEKR